jgi:hypothetical protein
MFISSTDERPKVLKIILSTTFLMSTLSGCAGLPKYGYDHPKDQFQRREEAIQAACSSNDPKLSGYDAKSLCKRKAAIDFDSTDPETLTKNSSLPLALRENKFISEKCYVPDPFSEEYKKCFIEAHREFESTDKEAVGLAATRKETAEGAESKRLASIKEFAKKNPKYAKYAKLAKEKKYSIGMPVQLFELTRVRVCKTNYTVVRSGEHAQLVLCEGGYVYTENGFITAFQN